MALCDGFGEVRGHLVGDNRNWDQPIPCESLGFWSPKTKPDGGTKSTILNGQLVIDHFHGDRWFIQKRKDTHPCFHTSTFTARLKMRIDALACLLNWNLDERLYSGATLSLTTFETSRWGFSWKQEYKTHKRKYIMTKIIASSIADIDYRCEETEDGCCPVSASCVTISNPDSLLAVKQGLILEWEAVKNHSSDWAHVRKPLVVSMSRRNEELRLHNQV
jgi:hypothetical protein